ncbi:MAG TPA: hypothetical protein VF281_03150 [Candidatus Saccharimonadales bacterium]
MAALVPSGQSTQLIGLPALSDETYRQLDRDIITVYNKYVLLLSVRDPSDYYTI